MLLLLRLLTVNEIEPPAFGTDSAGDAAGTSPSLTTSALGDRNEVVPPEGMGRRGGDRKQRQEGKEEQEETQQQSGDSEGCECELDEQTPRSAWRGQGHGSRPALSESATAVASVLVAVCCSGAAGGAGDPTQAMGGTSCCQATFAR